MPPLSEAVSGREAGMATTLIFTAGGGLLPVVVIVTRRVPFLGHEKVPGVYPVRQKVSSKIALLHLLELAIAARRMPYAMRREVEAP